MSLTSTTKSAANNPRLLVTRLSVTTQIPSAPSLTSAMRTKIMPSPTYNVTKLKKTRSIAKKMEFKSKSTSSPTGWRSFTSLIWDSLRATYTFKRYRTHMDQTWHSKRIHIIFLINACHWAKRKLFQILILDFWACLKRKMRKITRQFQNWRRESNPKPTEIGKKCTKTPIKRTKTRLWCKMFSIEILSFRYQTCSSMALNMSTLAMYKTRFKTFKNISINTISQLEQPLSLEKLRTQLC